MLSAILHTPHVLFAWLVDGLRRLPGSSLGGRLRPWLVASLVVAAGVVLVIWMIQPSAQRIGLAELKAGQLAPMQSWIIVSGVLEATPGAEAGAYTYRLTDPDVPLASLVVRSERPLSEGPTTVSGTIEGGRLPVPEGYEWSARLAADETLAQDAPPPWVAGLLAVAAFLVAAAGGVAYPVFVLERPRPATGRRGELRVGIRREAADPDDPPTAGRLDLGRWPGDGVTLRTGAAGAVPVRLHSAHTSVDAGVLRWLGRSEPALRVRASAEDMAIEFTSREDRDAAYAALAAEVEGRTEGQPA